LPFKDRERRLAYLKSWRRAYREKHGISYAAARVKKKLRELKAKLGKCQNPTGGLADASLLEFAHIKDTYLVRTRRGFRGRYRKYRDIMQHPDCYTILCHGCHDRFDAGMLDIKPKSLLELQFELGVSIWGSRLYLPLPAAPTPLLVPAQSRSGV